MSPVDDDFTPATGWRKSAKSNNSGDCVEVADGTLAPQMDGASDTALSCD